MKRSCSLIALVVLLALAAAAQTVTLPAGTSLRVKLDKTLTTFTNRAGDAFTAHVSQAVLVDGATVIPTGATVQGHITKVSEPRRLTGKPTIGIDPQAVLLPDGERLSIDASLVDTNLGDGTDVNEEGQFKGSGHSKKDIAIIAGGAGSGMLFGGLIGGGPGVAIGGAIGAGAGTTRWLIERRSANLPAGTELFLELNRPVTIGAEPVAGQ